MAKDSIDKALCEHKIIAPVAKRHYYRCKNCLDFVPAPREVEK